MRQLTVYDFFVYQVLCEAPGISIRSAHRVVTERIKAREVPSDYTLANENKSSVETSMNKLKECGLLDSKGKPAANARGFWNMIGRDWQQWPLYIPFDSNGVYYKNMEMR